MYFKKTFAILNILLITSCSIAPKYIGDSKLYQLATQDIEISSKNIDPLSEKLSLHEAIARGIKYNLDYKIKLLEETLVSSEIDVAKFDMLPKLTADAGYTYRDKYNIAKATDSVTGQPSLSNPFISSEKKFSTWGLGLNWNILDFGLGYINAKQNADRLIVANEKRRRAMHNLIEDIQVAYIRAASAQKLEGKLNETIRLAENALGNSKSIENSETNSPMDALRYQKSLLDTVKLLESIQSELSSAKYELGQLINLPHYAVTFDDPDLIATPKNLDSIDSFDLETLAIMNNAEYKESIYNARIAVEEARKGILKIMPNLSFNYGKQYTDNSYTINQNWLEGSSRLSFNLLNLFTLPSAMQLADNQEVLSQERRRAVQMSVITKVNLSQQELINSTKIFNRSKEISQVNRRILNITQNKTENGLAGDNELVSASTEFLLAELKKYQALSQLYLANGKLRSSVGYEPKIQSVDEYTIYELADLVDESSSSWSEENIKNEIYALNQTLINIDD